MIQLAEAVTNIDKKYTFEFKAREFPDGARSIVFDQFSESK